MKELSDEVILILLAHTRVLEARLKLSKNEVTKLQNKCRTYKRRIAKLKTPKVVGVDVAKPGSDESAEYVQVSKAEQCKDTSNYTSKRKVNIVVEGEMWDEAALCNAIALAGGKPKVFTNPPDIHEGHPIGVLVDDIDSAKNCMTCRHDDKNNPGCLDTSRGNCLVWFHKYWEAKEEKPSNSKCYSCKHHIDDIETCENLIIQNDAIGDCINLDYKYWEAKP